MGWTLKGIYSKLRRHTDMTQVLALANQKGGVGKTTCAGALALLSSRTERTLVVSLDPAHNLGDVLGRRLSGAPAAIAPNLSASEVDMDAAISRYLEESTQRLKGMYSYLKTINLEGYLDAMKLSPGIEEYATLQVMEELIRDAEGTYDVIVFDTPPTGLTLRVLALPHVSLMWGERLAALRIGAVDAPGVLEGIRHAVPGEVKRIGLDAPVAVGGPDEDGLAAVLGRDFLKFALDFGQ